MTLPTFPTDFLWGVATAGHQNEGDNVDSDTWFLENVSPDRVQGPSGKAANGWELWGPTSTSSPAWASTPTASRSSGRGSSPSEGEFSDEALAHYEAMVDGCLARGLAPIVTFNHFTSPHWFAGRGAWLDAEAPALFARYCERAVMDRFGDRIALRGHVQRARPARDADVGAPARIHRELERATLGRGTRPPVSSATALANVMLPRGLRRMRAGMTAAHRAAKAAIKARRPDLPVGLSLAIVDDVAAPGGEELRDRKRAEVYEHWLVLAA